MKIQGKREKIHCDLAEIERILETAKTDMGEARRQMFRAFDWSKSIEGFDYWYPQVQGDAPLDIARLEQIREELLTNPE